MTQIDALPRVTLSYFKTLLKNAEQVAEMIQQKPENREAIEARAEEWLSGSFTLSGVTYRVRVELPPDCNLEKSKSLFFEWESPKGEARSQRVYLVATNSNLGLSPVWYFLCPYCGRFCRKLFLDGEVIVSRWAFKHTYSQRNKSRKWREFDKLMDALKEDPKEKNRKTTYRGKLTPYGKKLVKWIEQSESGELIEQLSTLLESGSQRRIAPPKEQRREPQRKKQPTGTFTPSLFNID